MPRKVRQLRADIRRAGFRQLPGKGSHTKWVHPLLPGHHVIAGGDGDDAKPYQEQKLREKLEQVHEAQRRQQP